MKDSNNVPGCGRTSCPFYDQLDSILGTRAASSPPVLLDSGGSSSTVKQSRSSSTVQEEEAVNGRFKYL